MHPISPKIPINCWNIFPNLFPTSLLKNLTIRTNAPAPNPPKHINPPSPNTSTASIKSDITPLLLTYCQKSDEIEIMGGLKIYPTPIAGCEIVVLPLYLNRDWLQQLVRMGGKNFKTLTSCSNSFS